MEVPRRYSSSVMYPVEREVRAERVVGAFGLTIVRWVEAKPDDHALVLPGARISQQVR